MRKKIVWLVCAVLSISLLAGCGAEKAERIMYNTDLSKYVKLGDYKGLSIDMSSDEWKEAYQAQQDADVQENELYVHKTEGKVEDGDTVNIDYEGKKDGVAFAGGTAQGHDLTIGSNSFIDGFESGLIGKEIGSTVDLNLTFPEDYGSEELAGQDVVFTVKINYVATTEPLTPEEYYQTLAFDSLEDYEQDVRERTAKTLLLQEAVENAEISEYPEADIETIYTAYLNRIEQNLQSQNVDLQTYLSYINQTEEEFKQDTIDSEIQPQMQEQMVAYRILDVEKMAITQEEIQEQIDQIVAQYDSEQVTADVLKEFYGDYYFETLAANQKVADFLYKNAKIS